MSSQSWIITIPRIITNSVLSYTIEGNLKRRNYLLCKQKQTVSTWLCAECSVFLLTHPINVDKGLLPVQRSMIKWGACYLWAGITGWGEGRWDVAVVCLTVPVFSSVFFTSTFSKIQILTENLWFTSCSSLSLSYIECYELTGSHVYISS